MKTRWLHIIGGIVALSSIIVGISQESPFVSFSIAVALLIWWDARDSPNEDLLRKLSLREMEGLQRGFEKGMRIKEMFAVALLIPVIVMIPISPLNAGFLGIITTALILSAIASEIELEKMEIIERETVGTEPKYKLPRGILTTLFRALKEEFSAFTHRKKGLIRFLKESSLLLYSAIDLLIFRKGRAALVEHLGL